MEARETRAAVGAARARLDDLWSAVLAAQVGRDGEREAAIRARLADQPTALSTGTGFGLDAARLAWPVLDGTARAQWIAGFRSLWHEMNADPAFRRAVSRTLLLGKRVA